MAVHLESEKIQTGPVPESAARLFWFMKTNIRADDRVRTLLTQLDFYVQELVQ